MPARRFEQTSPTTLAIGSGQSFVALQQNLVSGVSNWQAAIIASSSQTEEIEFHLTASKNDAIGGGTNDSRPVLNGLQIIPVVEFLQPSVLADAPPLEYGPLPPGMYSLMYVHGAVNVHTSKPQYAGGWFRLVHSTENNPPSIMRLNYPEVNRYVDGITAALTYAGRQYTFYHNGGFLELSYDEKPNLEATQSLPACGTPPTPYILHGIAYADAGHSEPMAPVFALINLTALTAQNDTVNPVIFNPSYGGLPPAGIICSMFTTTDSALIYYTISSSTDATEPIEPPPPAVNLDGSLATGTLAYTEPLVITHPTKIKAFARRRGMLDSPISYIYYYDQSVY